MSQYGLWADELDPVDLARLIQSYARRKQFESRLLAGELAGSIAGQPERSTHSQPRTRGRAVTTSGRAVEVLPPDVLLGRLGKNR